MSTVLTARRPLRSILIMVMALGGALSLVLSLAHLRSAQSAPAADHTVCPSGCDFTTLQTAINAATAGQVIHLNTAAQTEENIQVNKGITLLGNGATATTIQGSGSNRIFHVTAPANQPVLIQDLAITKGNIGGLNSGGGLYSCGSTVTLERVHVKENSASAGGGVVNDCGGSMTLVESRVEGNSGSIAGGGVSNLNPGVMQIQNTTVISNETGADANGGGIFNSGHLFLSTSHVEGQETAKVGGGLFNSGHATVMDTDVEGNRASVDGGGLFSSGVISIYDSLIFDNHAQFGGGVLIQGESTGYLQNTRIEQNSADFGGGLFNVGILHVDHGSVVENQAPNGDGGGIFNQTSAAIEIRGSDIYSNRTAGNGGGIYNSGVLDLLNGAQVRNNHADANGGGLYNFQTDDVLVDDAIFLENRGFEGGGITNEQSSTILKNIHFEGNSAVAGGGLYNRTNSNPVVTNVIFVANWANNEGGAMTSASNSAPRLINALFSGNRAFDAGAIASRAGANTQLINVTVSGNHAFNEAGGMRIFNNASASVVNSIFHNNSDSTGAGLLGANITIQAGSGATFSHTLVQGSGGSGSWSLANSTDNGNNLDGDPQFVAPLSPSAAPTDGGNYALQDSSLVRNIGDNSANTTLLDPLGNPRIVNTVIDLGAFENATVPILSQFPVALGDEASTDEEISVLIDVLANDSDPNGDPLSIVGLGTPAGGTVAVEAGKIRFMPKPNFVGTTSFFYVINDGDISHTAQSSVQVTVNEVNDPPTGASLSSSTIAENQPAGTQIGTLTAQDPEGNGPFRFVLVTPTERGQQNDNGAFRIDGNRLLSRQSFNFEEKSTYSIQVQVSDFLEASTVQDLNITVLDGPDDPTDIVLSNDRIDENRPAGSVVGTLSSVDPDSGNTHSYSLVSGPGSGQNGSFRIVGNQLQTDEELDYEQRTVYNVRIRSTDNEGGTREESFPIFVNNLDDAPANSFSNCTGNDITLFSGSGTLSAKVEIKSITVSNVTADGCRVTGTMTVFSNGSQGRRLTNDSTSLSFTANVNRRNQFTDVSISNFYLSIVGMSFEARKVTVAYNWGEPGLSIGDARWRLPQAWGGLSSRVTPSPIVLDPVGLKFSSQKFDLPAFRTKNGIELSISGRLVAVSGAYLIEADGKVSIPNIGKKAGKKGQTCSIGAGVTIRVNTLGQTVLDIDASVDRPIPVDLQTDGAYSIMAADAIGVNPVDLDKIRLSFACSTGIPIGTTGVFLTGIAGEITLEPGNEAIDVSVSLAAGKSLPVLGPVIGIDGNMKLSFNRFKLALGGSVKVLSFENARAGATITDRGFSATITIDRVIYYGTVKVSAWTARSRFFMTASGDLALSIRKGSISQSCTRLPCGAKWCDGWLGIPYPCGVKTCRVCISIPPFSTGRLAGVKVEGGSFTNGTFGFKGVANILSISYGFFINDRGTFKFGNVNKYRLASAPQIAAARNAWRLARMRGQASIDPRSFGPYVFLEDETGRATGVIVDTPLEVVPEISASDAISLVNLIAEADASFQLEARAPLGFSLITPEGHEITPANFEDGGAPHNSAHNGVLYDQTVNFELESGEEDGDDERPTLRVSLLSPENSLSNVDVRIDGVKALFGLDFSTGQSSDRLALEAGTHTVELLTAGSESVLLSTNVNMVTGTHYSLLTVEPIPARGIISQLQVLEDDRSAPALGKARLRLYNGAHRNLDLLLNGSSVIDNVGLREASAYVEVAAGQYTLRYQSGGSQMSADIEVNLDEGDVYTFFAAEFPVKGFDVAGMQRLDESYVATYRTSYNVDQAMGVTWRAKITGDTDNADFVLLVSGPDAPPVLSDITVNASNLASTNVSWRVSSDFRPVTMTVYLNPGDITTTLTITDPEGNPSLSTVTLFEGPALAEFVLDDVNELGGQLVSRSVDLSNMESGTYHMWVRAEDAAGSAVSGYASTQARLRSAARDRYGANTVRLAKEGYSELVQAGAASPIVIDRSSDFPSSWTTQFSIEPDEESDGAKVEWSVNPHPDVNEYRLLVGTVPLSVTQIISAGNAVSEYDEDGNAVGAPVGFAILPDIVPGQTYHLSVDAVDSETGRSVRSQEEVYQQSTGDFKLTSPSTNYAVAAGGSVQIPISREELAPLFEPQVNVNPAATALPTGLNAAFVESVDGITVLNSNSDVVNLLVVVDQTLADGRYSIQILGSNGHLDRSLSVELVVGTGGSKLYLPSVER